jgi:hypothetical protein
VSRQRAVSVVPRWVLLLLTACLSIQIAWKSQTRPGMPGAEDLPLPPGPRALRIAALGEPATLARLAMLYLQSFDYHGSNALPYRKLDYDRLVDWLASIQALDPLSQYPLFAAARIYAEVPDPARQRKMLEFIYSEFKSDPNRRWPWAAHAALVAKHRLKDLPLALKYAESIDRLTTATDIPLWAKQMTVFILEDMNELNAARVMLGGLLATGRIQDARERQFLERRLKQMEAKIDAREGSEHKRKQSNTRRP